LLFACLFTVTAAFAGTSLAADGLAWLGARALLPDNIAVLAPLAGNFLIVGSLANLIVAERAAVAGVPMTLLSMSFAALWLGIGGWMPWR
jgi:Na+/H+ antiporter NhaD/arsenite permease-like protein